MARKVIVRRLTGASVFNALLAISFPHAVRRLFAMRTSLDRPCCPEIGATPPSGDDFIISCSGRDVSGRHGSLGAWRSGFPQWSSFNLME